ncbi:MAG TPA: efflux RND transporter periplasmic adaptor subunit, partial [Opitutaceae bacterium]|nr:efflux RND transporter periplasmic adaptor subunit [Opitutaceae bacterium]
AADAPKPVEVKTARPSRGEIVRYISLPGIIRANQQVTLYAKVGGYLKSIAVDKGDAVKSGQSLGEIEVPELLADSTRYKAEVTVAQSDFKRVSEAQAKAADLVTAESVDAAKAKWEVAQANLERADTLLHYAKITAPFGGIITARFVDPGAFIPAATGSTAQSAALVTLTDFEIVRAQVAVPELESSRVQVGQPVKVSVEGLSGKTFEGKVTRFSYTLDEATRTMLVEADLPNKELILRPGMYASIKVGVEKHVDALLIPSDALMMERTNAFAFVLDNGKAHRLPIKIGFNDGSKVEVLSGLTGNEPVISLGKLTLTEGQSVQAIEAP